MSTDGWPYEPGMSSRPPVVWFQLVTVSRLTVPPFLRNVVGPTWNSLRCECPPKSGSGSSSRIREFSPKRSR